MARKMQTSTATDKDISATAFKGNDAMAVDFDLLGDRLVLEHFLTVLHRLREDTHAVIESGPTPFELVGGYFLLIDPTDSTSGFAASVHFAPPGVDAVMIAEGRIQGGKADLF